MKLKKHILAMGLVCLLVSNNIFTVYAAPKNDLTLTKDISEGISTEIEYGSTVTKYQFDVNILSGVQEDDEVYLVADAEYDSIDAGERKITLSNFELVGADAASYTIPEIDEPVVKDITITKKVIKVVPTKKYIYYGQMIPDNLIEIDDYSDEIVDNDEVNICAKFRVKEDNTFEIIEDTLECDNENYTVIVDDTVRFEEREFVTNEVVQTNTNEYVGVNKATLSAPTGFLISTENEKDSVWSESIEIDLEETQNGAVKYYLRCNDVTNTEYYQAISTEKTYTYTSDQTLPEIISMSVVKKDDNTTLNFLPFGLFGNGSVTVLVEAVGTTSEQNTKIYLSENGENSTYESKDAIAQMKEEKYHYMAEFDINISVEDDDTGNDSKYLQLQTYAYNSSGKSEKYESISGISDLDNSNKFVESLPIVLEQNVPNVTTPSFQSDKEGVTCDFTIQDIDSGIAKIEYGWDLDRNNCNDDKNNESNKFCGFKENNYSNEYIQYDFDNSVKVNEINLSLKLCYEDAVWAKDNKHILHIRVTDNAGNVYNNLFQDPQGSDMNKPNIRSVEIRKKELNAIDSVLRFLTFGTFSNDSVEIAVIADDISADGTSASGVAGVKLNDCEMEKNDKGEYVLTVSADSKMETMKITVVDKIGWDATVAITEIADKTGFIQDDDLIVEDNPPIVSWNFSPEGKSDGNGKVWYGAEDSKATFTIKATENVEGEKSGLYSVKIKDNENNLVEKNDFSSLETEFEESFVIGDFAEGVHTIVVEVEDNAGNKLADAQQVTFYIDNKAPEKGTVSIQSPQSVVVDEKQWFDKDDVVEFRVDTHDEDSGIKNILMDINGQKFLFEGTDIKSDAMGCYVLVDTNNIAVDEEHKYTITGKVTDYAGNYAEIETIYVYKDMGLPQIDKLTVENKSSIVDKILTVLSFGVYTNDTLLLKAYVSDIQYDSGIDYVTIEYDDSKPQKMNNEGNGVFSTEISKTETLYECCFVVTTYDKMGKSSVNVPQIHNVYNEDKTDSHYIMIESSCPSVILNFPACDDLNRTDGQRWYDNFNNSNKEITFSVQDSDSGIRNVELKVNGIEIERDRYNIALLKAKNTEKKTTRDTRLHTYAFDIAYFMDKVEEPKDGKYTIIVEVTDNAGNITSFTEEFYIDKTEPKIDKIEFLPTAADGVSNTTEFIENLEYGFFFKTDFNMVVYVSDNMSSAGLDVVEYRLVSYENGTRKEEFQGSELILGNKAEIKIPSGFKGQVYVDAYDNVNNHSGEKTTKGYIVDDAAPDINIVKNAFTSFSDAEGNPLYVDDYSFTVEVTDIVSGIREIGYVQSADQNSYDRKNVVIGNTKHQVGDELGDGWMVSAIDENLVTKATKTFKFTADDNDVVLTFDTIDNAFNKNDNVKSEKFTIDKTQPIIDVVFHEDSDEDIYYNQERIADITIIERNFDEKLIRVMIGNAFGDVPSFSFIEKSKTEYVAVIQFDEGDYTFDVNGTDLGNHTAIVNFSGGNEKLFSVDKTQPLVEENFNTFINATAENSFNSDKVVNIKVTEHNFKPELVKVSVLKKEAGAEHNAEGFMDATSEILKNIGWTSVGDVHTISFVLSNDAVYQVAISPKDLAGNEAEHRSTVIFEIDKTVPIVAARNGISVNADSTEYIDIYTYLRADESAPTVEFSDLNIAYIKYVFTVYSPDSVDSSATSIKPDRVYLDEDTNRSGIVQGNKFVLPNFIKDGVYALELVAVDKAGNESVLNENTYVRLIKQDVLAYVMDSNLKNETGLYSIQYENGDAISKRPDNFKDIKICVFAQEDTEVDVILRDNNGYTYYTNAQAEVNDSIYGMSIYEFLLESDFFKETFQDDTDAELYLSIMNGENRIDLGKLHIDNIAPTCDLPTGFTSWKWFYGEESQTILLSDISELIDVNQCKVYDNGKEIAFTYSSEENSLKFTLEKGWHNVGVTLKDMAGNTYNIQEITNIHIGYFWLWVISTISVVTIGVVGYIIVRNVRKKKLEENII